MTDSGRAVAAIVPAAGAGARFGGQKLLADIGGAPLIARTLASLLDGGVDTVVVVVRETAWLSGLDLRAPRVRVVVNPEPERGMFSSIQAGLDATGDDPVLVLPADMPFVSAGTVSAVVGAVRRSDRVVTPVFEGRGGHPVGIPARLRASLLALPAATTLKAALAAMDGETLALPVDDPGIIRDVDRAGDLEKGSDAGDVPITSEAARGRLPARRGSRR